ncbi:MAG: asparagine synthase (glutamine-hydrolyzing) [Euryarchaeota archaeon]|nr:asparagine synthase (glutamine-hydrolyzing) [Euryarchaeota archaeon]
MCGIVGIIGENISDQLYNMLTTIKHRGPDGCGVFVDGKVEYGDLYSLKVPQGSFGIGHNLLSIIGSEGSQPICDENFVLVCNGEIYNFKELKQDLKSDFKTDSDCEVITKLVKKFYHGSLADAVIKAVENLDGDYAFTIFDGKNFAAIRDPVGVKPLYFGENLDKNIFAFASERKALFNVGVEDVITLPPDFMLYNKKLLRLDDRLKIKNQVFEIKEITTQSITKQYIPTKPTPTQQNLDKTFKRSYPELKEILKKHLTASLIKSVKKRIKGLSQVGIIFSGGIDSTLIAAISNELGIETILYSVGHEDSIDLKFAKKVARDIGLALHIKTVTVEDVRSYLPLVLNAIEEFNIMKIGVGMPAYIASKMAHNNGLKVMLSGQGADELFGGYHRYLKLYHEKGETAQEDLKEDILNLYHVNLQRDDAVTMANSVELRVPYLDLDIINIAMNIPMKYKIKDSNDKLRKCILREVAAEFGVPKMIVERPKKAAQYGSGIHKMLIKKVLKDFKPESSNILLNKTYKG